MIINTRPGQWVGIALVLVSCGAFGFALPRYAATTSSDNVQVTEVAEGTRVSEDPVSIVPGDGWSQSTEVPGILLLKKGDTIFIANPPTPATGEPLADIVRTSSEAFAGDASYDIGDPVPFTTTSGLDGAELLLAAPDGTSVIAAVSDGSQTVTISVNAATKDWPDVGKDIDPMLESIEIGAGDASGTGNGS